MLLIVCRLIGIIENTSLPTMSKDPSLIRFGQSVRQFRSALGISQEKLAELAELHRTYVGAIERGERNVSLVNIVKLSRALKASPCELLRGIE